MRRRLAAALGSAIFFAIAPVGVAGLVPWLLTGWRSNPQSTTLRVLGFLLILASVPVLVMAFARFVTEGIGTPAPVAPTQHLVVGGLYRYVRNPMYLSVVCAIVGQALILGQLSLIAYAIVAGAAMFAFATWVEEPSLVERFGAEYETYRRNVPGWWPRATPWKGDG
ncbi:MAG TPA: isoprenylcysteine carboxylmethyltransferase family protein [Candidatus Dormibacteraeota bacterium]|nr:isoprenylcysteine carboxylmethyltransferase family protein [Candidatus Dormibacteraeota bacterium]